jgi:nitrite reductase/ring-hydroxylating ferredoxin subunit
MTAFRRLCRPAWRRPPDPVESAAVLDLGPVAQVLAGGRAQVTVGPDETPVLVIKTARGVFAMRNRCPHRGLPLDGATTRGRYVRCGFHGREYDMASGTCRPGTREPGARRLVTYRCWIDAGHVFLALPGQPVDDVPEQGEPSVGNHA